MSKPRPSGLGFGWVKVDQLIDIEEEDVSDARPSIELTFTYIPRTDGAFVALNTLLVQVGRQLSYLDVSRFQFGFEKTIFSTILEHCVNIKHLVLADTWLSDENLDDLMDALDGDLGRRLLSLNLNANLFDDVIATRLAEFLADRDRVPVLQELRLVMGHLVPRAYSALHNALVVNKKLRFLELVEPHRALEQGHLTAQNVCRRINEDHRAELLPSPLPLKHKLAFLSVIKPQAHGRIAAHVALDSFVVSSIFKFAAEDVRRRIIWSKAWS